MGIFKSKFNIYYSGTSDSGEATIFHYLKRIWEHKDNTEIISLLYDDRFEHQARFSRQKPHGFILAVNFNQKHYKNEEFLIEENHFLSS